METETIHIEGLGDVPVERIRLMFKQLVPLWLDYKQLEACDAISRKLHRPLHECDGVCGALQDKREEQLYREINEAMSWAATTVFKWLESFKCFYSEPRP